MKTTISYLSPEEWKQLVDDKIIKVLDSALKDVMSHVDNNTLVVMNIVKKFVLFLYFVFCCNLIEVIVFCYINVLGKLNKSQINYIFLI